MQNIEQIISLLTNILFVISLGFYLITNLQWYNYKIERAVLKHHKPFWHIFYFIIPFVLYYTTGKFFFIFFYFAYLPALFIWHKRLDKKLVFTWRVKRFFILLIALTLFGDFLCFIKESCLHYGVMFPLFLAYVGSMGIEKYLFLIYKKEAKKKLQSIDNLEIITVTASYGKTSIKNFLASLLAHKYQTYATPRSVNTLAGIIKDINEDLPTTTEFYVVEAGARERGDIYAISDFIQPQTVIVGKIGAAHIEYFKTLENIIKTKLEVMASKRLKKAFIHCSVTDEEHPKVEFFCENQIKNLQATLDGLSFSITLDDQEVPFKAPNILGAFQATNLLVAIKAAYYYGVDIKTLQKGVAQLQSIPHRLQKIEAGGKIILDDGFNGNIDGMKEAIRLCSLHHGRKVIITPGLVESTQELNKELIETINGVFDIVIVTGKLNAKLFDTHLQVSQKILLEDKSKLEEILAKTTKSGDIILFANDAPNFI